MNDFSFLKIILVFIFIILAYFVVTYSKDTNECRFYIIKIIQKT